MEFLKDEKKEKREEIVKFWATFQKMLAPFAQERVKERVLNGWSLEKALRNEGIMCIRHSLDLSLAREMFKSGELKISEPRKVERVAKDITKKEAEEFGLPEGQSGKQAVDEPAVVYQKTGDSFVPRPKNKK